MFTTHELGLWEINLKRDVVDLEGNKVKEIELPWFFALPVRKDLIRRAYLSEFTARLQPKGRDPLAGKRTSARSLGVGHGMARIPRIRPSLRGAFINSTVGGMVAFPPKPEKRIHEEINKKEKRLATLYALAATARRELVTERGHVVKTQVPIIIINDFESLNKTKEVKEVLKKIGVWDDIVRADEHTKIRAGKGKMRGRRYKKAKGPLFILSSEEVPVRSALDNLPGVDVVSARIVSVKHLAPGGVPGRLTVITLKGLEELTKRLGGT